MFGRRVLPSSALPLRTADKCLLVRYPSRQHFLLMMGNAAYGDAQVHRYAGRERAVLLQMPG